MFLTPAPYWHTPQDDDHQMNVRCFRPIDDIPEGELDENVDFMNLRVSGAYFGRLFGVPESGIWSSTDKLLTLQRSDRTRVTLGYYIEEGRLFVGG